MRNSRSEMRKFSKNAIIQIEAWKTMLFFTVFFHAVKKNSSTWREKQHCFSLVKKNSIWIFAVLKNFRISDLKFRILDLKTASRTFQNVNKKKKSYIFNSEVA